jgi:hypothetical protein
VKRRLANAALAALVGLAIPLAALAQDSLEIAKRREIEEISRQARENREQANALRPKETRALGELRRTEKQLTDTRRRL